MDAEIISWMLNSILFPRHGSGTRNTYKGNFVFALTANKLYESEQRPRKSSQIPGEEETTPWEGPGLSDSADLPEHSSS